MEDCNWIIASSIGHGRSTTASSSCTKPKSIVRIGSPPRQESTAVRPSTVAQVRCRSSEQARQVPVGRRSSRGLEGNRHARLQYHVRRMLQRAWTSSPAEGRPALSGRAIPSQSGLRLVDVLYGCVLPAATAEGRRESYWMDDTDGTDSLRRRPR